MKGVGCLHCISLSLYSSRTSIPELSFLFTIDRPPHLHFEGIAMAFKNYLSWVCSVGATSFSSWVKPPQRC